MVESARLYCLRHGESANVVAGAAGAPPYAPLTARGREQALAAAAALHHEPVAGVYASAARRSQRTAEVLRSWVVDGNLHPRVADGEDGHAVVVRMTGALDAIVDAHPGATAVVVGHIASLTVALATICHLGTEIWGAPLPHAVPFLVVRTPNGWQCRSWPARPGTTGQR